MTHVTNKDEHIWLSWAQEFVVETTLMRSSSAQDDCVEFDPPRFFQTDLETHRPLVVFS